MDNIFSLEQLINSKVEVEFDGEQTSIVPDLRIAKQKELAFGVHVIVHPAEHSGTTLDFVVCGNTCAPLDLVVTTQRDNSEVIDTITDAQRGVILDAMGAGIVKQVVKDVLSILDSSQIKDSTKVRNLIEDQLRKVAIFDGFDFFVSHRSLEDVTPSIESQLGLDSKVKLDTEVYASVVGTCNGVTRNHHHTEYTM